MCIFAENITRSSNWLRVPARKPFHRVAHWELGQMWCFYCVMASCSYAQQEAGMSNWKTISDEGFGSGEAVETNVDNSTRCSSSQTCFTSFFKNNNCNQWQKQCTSREGWPLARLGWNGLELVTEGGRNILVRRRNKKTKGWEQSQRHWRDYHLEPQLQGACMTCTMYAI